MTKKLVKTKNDNSDCSKAGVEEHADSKMHKTETKGQKSAVFEVVRHIKKSQRAERPIKSAIINLKKPC